MSKTWHAVITDEPDLTSEYPTDPKDWKIEFELRDDDRSYIHEVIYVTFTGTIGDNDEVIATPEERVEDCIDAMLKGLNRLAKRESKSGEK
jgi:hypothetical protein